jgi:hypothetical protein
MDLPSGSMYVKWQTPFSLQDRMFVEPDGTLHSKAPTLKTLTPFSEPAELRVLFAGGLLLGEGIFFW